MPFLKLRKKVSYLMNSDDPFTEILKDLKVNDFSLPYPYPENKVQKSVNAFEKIVLIAKSYNDGWISDMGDTEQAKYVPYKYKNSAGVWVCVYYGWCSNYVGYPSGVHFKSSELAMKAIKNFEKIYDDYFMI